MLFLLIYIGLLAGLLFMYQEEVKKEPIEFGLKLLGYYVVASLPFRLFWISLPIGFLITFYLLTQTRVKYKKQKQLASLLGLIVFFLNMFI
jgi:hypothetical protein